MTPPEPNLEMIAAQIAAQEAAARALPGFTDAAARAAASLPVDHPMSWDGPSGNSTAAARARL